MEDVGGQFGPMPEANPTTEATANDVVQSNKASGSFQGHMADASAGNSSLWKQKQLEIIELITSQEDANNQLSSGITAFVESTSTMKKVCIPCSPRAPWQIFIDNPSWCSKRN
jgi:3-deoxy-D-arabino-heptulosonate 7-phosphate (DAHP) synthase